VLEAQTGMAHAARFPRRVGPTHSALERCLASSFHVCLHIYIEKGVTYETEAIRETERRQSHDHRFGDQIDLGFLPRKRESEVVFTAIISINHELHLHHHV
jgi:hypothetical protein